MSGWQNDPDDPANRLMLEPTCPRCSEPAYQEARLDPSASDQMWRCTDCGHDFESPGVPLGVSEETFSSLVGKLDSPDGGDGGRGGIDLPPEVVPTPRPGYPLDDLPTLRQRGADGVPLDPYAGYAFDDDE